MQAGLPLLRRHFAGWAADTPRDHRGHVTEVWAWHTPAGRVYLKRHSHQRKYVQEKQAILRWADFVRMPAMIDYDDAERALLLAEAPGVSGARRSLPPDAHILAGRWLKRLHSIVEPDPDPTPWLDGLSLRIDRAIHQARTWLEPRVVDDVVAPLRDLARQSPPVRRVPCHRDFDPRNWVYDGSLTVLDFEHSRLDAAPWDFTRLATAYWPEHPELHEAFVQGYGRVDASFVAWVRALTRFDAMGTLVWGLAHNDEAFIARGRRALARKGGALWGASLR